MKYWKSRESLIFVATEDTEISIESITGVPIKKGDMFVPDAEEFYWVNIEDKENQEIAELTCGFVSKETLLSNRFIKSEIAVIRETVSVSDFFKGFFEDHLN